MEAAESRVTDTHWEEMLLMPTAGKGLIFRIYKHFCGSVLQRPNRWPNQKWTHDSDRHVTVEDVVTKPVNT